MGTERCAARGGSDGQTRCVACRLIWDTNDPEPPACGRMLTVHAPDDSLAHAHSSSSRQVADSRA